MRANVNPSCWIWLLLLVGLGTLGCADDSTCDPGQEFKDGFCRVAPDDAGSGGSTAVGGSGGVAGVEDSGRSGAAGADSCAIDFGDACTDDEDCGCDAPVCATLPGSFLCTNTCDDDPGVCPDGFVCEDLSRFGDYPSTCLPEGALAF